MQFSVAQLYCGLFEMSNKPTGIWLATNAKSFKFDALDNGGI